MKRIFFVAIILMVFVVSNTFAETDPNLYKVKGGYFCTSSNTNIREFVTMMKQNDTAAMRKMIEEQKVLPTSAGVKVYVVYGGYHGEVEVRQEGFTGNFWTYWEALELVEGQKPQEITKTGGQDGNILDGIVTAAKGKYKAMINGEMYSAGDDVGGIKIKKVNSDSIEVDMNGINNEIAVGGSF
jgi:hypothetical protein